MPRFRISWSNFRTVSKWL